MLGRRLDFAFLMLRPSDDGTALLTAALVSAKKPFVALKGRWLPRERESR